MPREPRRILVVRNDRLGDFMLAFPALHVLRRGLPEAGIHVLVPEYTRELAEACRAVDEVLIDPGARAPAGEQREFRERLRAQRYDAVVVLFSTWRIGWHLFRTGIPYRIAPATKLAQILYPRRLVQRRSRSLKPEWEYNVDLAHAFLRDAGVQAPPTPPGPYLTFDSGEIAELRAGFRRERNIPPESPLVFIHAGSGGSTRNLSPTQFARLARLLHGKRPLTTVVSAGPGEDGIARHVAGHLGDVPHTVYLSNGGLRRFAEHLAFADVFVSGSTGPLHVAGALDRPTAAFYPPTRASCALRWQTLSAPGRRLAFSPPPGGDGDMQQVDLEAAAETIVRSLLVP